MLESKLNIDSFLQTIIPDAIEAFVDFYGEEERANITNRFNSIITIGYLSLNGYSNLVYEAKKQVKAEAIKHFFKLLNIDYDETLAKIFFGSLSSIEKGTLDDYYKNKDKDYFKSFIDDFASKIREHLKSQGKVVSSDEIYQMLDSYESAFKDSVVFEKKIFNEKYGKYQSYLQQIEKIKDDMNKKYFMLYLKEIMPYLSAADQQKIANIDIDNYFLYTFEEGGLYLSFTADISHNTKISAFTSESERMLNDDNVPDWQKESIRSERIDYFKKMGFDYGDDYEAYLADSECKRIIPSLEHADKICSLKTSLEHQAVEETILAMPHIAAVKKRVDEADLVIKEGEFLSTIIKELTCIVPNYKLVDGKLEYYPVMHINGNRDIESFDCTLIHELNHIYELCLLGYDEKMIHSVSGWDICDDEIKDKEEVSHEKDPNKRNYEMLNEVINELLAQEICTLMHKKGKFLLGDSQTSINTSRSSYAKLFCLVKEFYFEFKDSIIASRKNGNIQAIYDAVGKDNFEALNLLCHDYEMYFSGFKIYNLYNALEKGVDNDLTRFHNECLRKKDEIIERMRAYSKEKKQSI
ncbi:MAG: hypothetical protein IKR74_04110 [Bacilli bacterium]|nr:hypothetical protein [Bacilli bacterium]